VATFTVTSAAEVICNAATLTGSLEAVAGKLSVLAGCGYGCVADGANHVATPAPASRRAVSNSGNPTTPE
jgi:hypothetical protein